MDDITIPKRVTKIADNLFSGCYNLAEICLPEKISDIGESVFSECEKLTEFAWPQNITEIKNSIFCRSGLAHFIIPTTVTKIGEYAFQWCELKEISIPESVTDIQKMAFGGTENLAVIVTKGSYGEQYCKKCKLMENIYKSIPYADFKELFKLTSRYFDDYVYRDRVLNYLVFYPPYSDSIEPARDVFEVEDYSRFKKCLSNRADTSLDEEGFAIAMNKIKEIRNVAENDYEEVEGDPSKVRYILNKTE